MPSGSGATTLQNVPVQQGFVTDPQAFFQMTERNVRTADTVAAPVWGSQVTRQLPQVGVLSKLVVNLKGTLTVTSAAATTSNLWPYNALAGFNLSANGTNDLFNCSGIDLHVLKYIKYPAYKDAVDVFPGSVGGGDSVAVGTYPINLTWEVPIALEETSLVGSVFAQSSATNISARLAMSDVASLFSANGQNVAFSGVFNLQTTTYEVPYDGQGQLVLPDLSMLHGFNAVETPLSNSGEARTPLIRATGQLLRLFASGHAATGNRLSAAANAATTKKLEAIRLSYGGNQRPYEYDPAELLLSLNNQHYGSTPPYDRLVLDFIRDNPVRDTVLLEGVTELAVTPRIGTGVTITPGQGTFRAVQETLF